MRPVALYRIVDEPRPGVLGRLLSQPLVPLLSFMFVGAFLSWPWFVFNSFALGSHRRWRDLSWAVAGFGVRAALVVGLIRGFETFHLEHRWFGLAYILVSLWCFAVTYRLFLSQQDSAELYEAYGGPLGTRGLVVMIAAAVLMRQFPWSSSAMFLLFLR